jgi:MFS family permease
MAAVFSAFLVTGAALPVIPRHIHDNLGFGVFVVGLVSGAQFVVALASRLWAGAVSDRRGPKFAVVTGLVLAAIAGTFYLSSLAIPNSRVLSVAVLLAGRAVLGGAESFIMVGAQSWSLGLLPTGNAGQAIGWIGTSMFVALALGSPLGSVGYDTYGFLAIGLLTVTGALATLLFIAWGPDIKSPAGRVKGVFASVFKGVWLPGLGMAFASINYGTMATFAVLLYVQRGWEPAWLSFSAFAASLVFVRTGLGWVPDRIGGSRTAAIFVSVQSAGMALIWCAPSAWLAFAGASLAGLGYALVYPGFGIEAVRRAPEEAKGLAMGIYTAFIDLALGVLVPTLGLLANAAGLQVIFLINALLALSALPIAIWLKSHPAGQARP